MEAGITIDRALEIIDAIELKLLTYEGRALDPEIKLLSELRAIIKRV